MSASNTPKPTSRRGFLKRLSQMGAALGLGIAGVVATTDSAQACPEPQEWWEYRYTTTACGRCAGYGDIIGKRTYTQRRYCIKNGCTGIVNCNSWQDGVFCAGC